MLGKVETINGVKQITNLTSEVSNVTLEDVYPIGFVYTQYPQQKSPAQLFPNFTWTELSYDGAFFRASGTNANPFITANDTLTPQAQATAVNGLSVATTTNLSCYFYHTTAYNNTPSNGMLTSSGKNSPGNSGGSAYDSSGVSTINANHSHSLSGDTETRPTNYTIKIWARTA